MSHNNFNSEYDACDIVNGWLDDKITGTGWREVMRNYDRKMGKLVAGYETDRFLISISAWTQGNCLDVDVLDKHTRAITMHCVGPCEQRGEVLTRLNRLTERIKNCDLR